MRWLWSLLRFALRELHPVWVAATDHPRTAEEEGQERARTAGTRRSRKTRHRTRECPRSTRWNEPATDPAVGTVHRRPLPEDHPRAARALGPCRARDPGFWRNRAIHPRSQAMESSVQDEEPVSAIGFTALAIYGALLIGKIARDKPSRPKVPQPSSPPPPSEPAELYTVPGDSALARSLAETIESESETEPPEDPSQEPPR